MMVPWVILTRTVTDIGIETTISIDTNRPTHLRVCIEDTYPTRVPLYRVRRGVQIQCGYQLRHGRMVCHEQDEPGDTTTHTFTIDTPADPPSTWATITEGSEPTYGLQSTIPFPLTPDVIVPPLPALELERTSPFAPFATVADPIPWESIVAQRAWSWSPSTYGDAITPAAGWLIATLVAPFDDHAGQIVTCAIQSDHDNDSYFGPDSPSAPGHTNTAAVSFLFHTPAGAALRGLAQVAANGPGTVRPGVTHPCRVSYHYISLDP